MGMKGKVAIVTGATGGIGSEIVKLLAEKGVYIAAAGRRVSLLNELSSSLVNKIKVLPVKCDITKKEDLENLVDVTLKEFKTIDILINCAGVSSQYLFHEQPIDDIELLLQTNFFGYVVLTRLVLPYMLEKKTGHIINITSGSVMVDPPPRKFSVYTSLKVALRSFAKGIFWELRDQGIKVTSIFPGVTSTPLTHKLSNISQSESDRLIQPSVVADAVHFALKQPANVCPLELSVGNQRTPWIQPIIPFKQEHPET